MHADLSPIRFWRFAWLCSALTLVAPGCVQREYRFGRFSESATPVRDETHPAVLIGGPLPNMDATERRLYWPTDRYVAWKRTQSPREEQPQWMYDTPREAVAAAVDYLEDNGLDDVIVEARHHDPAEQWKRLQANPNFHPLWKYTDGSARVLTYSLFPPRLFRNDSYNPYTNTLSINSSNRVSAVFEAAKAKNSASKSWPGAYASMRYIPFVPAGHYVAISNDALTYARQIQDREMEQRMIPHAYANVAGAAVSAGLSVASGFIDPSGATSAVATATGTAVGSAAGYGAGYGAASWQAQREERMSERTNARGSPSSPNRLRR